MCEGFAFRPGDTVWCAFKNKVYGPVEVYASRIINYRTKTRRDYILVDKNVRPSICYTIPEKDVFDHAPNQNG